MAAVLSAVDPTNTAGLYNVLVALIGVAGLIAVTLLTARKAGSGAGADAGREAALAASRQREDDCLDSLEWAFRRIAVLEDDRGIPVSEPPPSLQRARARRDLYGGPA